MKVAELMRTDLILARPEADFETLLRKYAEVGSSRLIYVTDDSLVLLGLVSAHDILGRMLPARLTSEDKVDLYVREDLGVFRKALDANRKRTAREIMTSGFVSLKPDDHILKANLLLVDKNLKVIPVLDETGRIVGEVTRRLVLSYLAKNL